MIYFRNKAGPFGYGLVLLIPMFLIAAPGLRLAVPRLRLQKPGAARGPRGPASREELVP